MIKEDIRNKILAFDFPDIKDGTVIFPKRMQWEERTYYVVDVAFSANNPIHRTIFFSGFLHEDKPAGYNEFFNEDRSKITDAFLVKIVKKIDML